MNIIKKYLQSLLRIFNLSLAIFFIGTGCAKTDDEATLIEKDDIIQRSFTDNGRHFEMTFKKQTSVPIENVYMIYGVLPNNANGLSDAYIAAIPVVEAKSLLARYPDMDKCNGEGSDVAKSTVTNLNIIYPKSHIPKKNLSAAEKIYRSSKDRICLKVKGTMLQNTEALLNGKPTTILGKSSYVYLSDAQVVSCD